MLMVHPICTHQWRREWLCQPSCHFLAFAYHGALELSPTNSPLLTEAWISTCVITLTTQKQAGWEAVYGRVLSLTVKSAEFKHGEAFLTVNSNEWEIVAAHSCSIPSLSSKLCITVRTKLDHIKSQKEGSGNKRKYMERKNKQINPKNKK